MEQEVACAKALGADNLRVWAGPYGSVETSEKLFSLCVREARCLAERCAAEGMTLSFEYHQGTLTDSADSACRLMEAIDHPNARLYWQPNQAYDRDWNLTALKKVLPYVSNLHVFAWKGDQRFPLSEGVEDWSAYLKLLREDPKIHHMQLEFVKDDMVEQFCQDCKVFLKEF